MTTELKEENNNGGAAERLIELIRAGKQPFCAWAMDDDGSLLFFGNSEKFLQRLQLRFKLLSDIHLN